jgi:uncharacterized protein YndB with AHSA1/START domain
MPDDDIKRHVRRRQIAAVDARCIVIRKRYDAPVDAVWAAITQPDCLDRWFRGVSGDLRVGGAFAFDANTHGRILRCEPPRTLAVSWAYMLRPADEVQVHLTPDSACDDDDATTMLELEHATVAGLVEWDGVQRDVLPDIGAGWEVPLVYSLPKYLAGALPDAPAAEWYEPTDEDMAVAARAGEAWSAIVPSIA